MKTKLALLILLTVASICHAQERQNNFEAEIGLLTTQNMEIHGYNQNNATSGWKKNEPDVRLEYWSKKENDWNYGVVLQPLAINYADRLTNTLSYRGVEYQKGDDATLHYQFPTLRFTGNYPIFTTNDGRDYVRIGGSAIVRYAKVKLTTINNSFSNRNLIALPVFNVEANKYLGDSYSLFTRSDLLPSINGNTFLDGLFDVFLGVRKQLNNGDTVDVGVRSFLGGHDPKESGNYANRIFFNAVVVRYSWN